MAAKKPAKSPPKPARPGLTDLGALRRVDPAAFERTIREALEASDRNQVRAAARLGISERQMRRWVAELREAGVDLPTRPPGGDFRRV